MPPALRLLLLSLCAVAAASQAQLYPDPLETLLPSPVPSSSSSTTDQGTIFVTTPSASPVYNGSSTSSASSSSSSSTSSSAASTTPASTPTTTLPMPTVTVAAASASNDELSDTAVGLIAGGVALLLLLILLLLVVLAARRRQQRGSMDTDKIYPPVLSPEIGGSAAYSKAHVQQGEVNVVPVRASFVIDNPSGSSVVDAPVLIEVPSPNKVNGLV